MALAAGGHHEEHQLVSTLQQTGRTGPDLTASWSNKGQHARCTRADATVPGLESRSRNQTFSEMCPNADEFTTKESYCVLKKSVITEVRRLYT